MYSLESSLERTPLNLFQQVASFLEKTFGEGAESDYYSRYNNDHTRLIQLHRDRACEVSRAGLYSIGSIAGFLGEVKVDGLYTNRIMEIVRSGEKGAFHYTIIVESIPIDGSLKCLEHAHYNEDGILHVTGFSSNKRDSPESTRKDLFEKGHLMTLQLLPHIDFEETAKRFLLNAVSNDPSFDTPVLAPFSRVIGYNAENESLQSGREPALSLNP